MSRVLIVDDEKNIVKGIRFSLEQDGMETDHAYDGDEAVRMVRENDYDIVLLDVMLPGKTGFEVCREIREFSSVPVIMLTARTEDMDKILGLEYGADDYVTKPFNILEVKARIKAILRRTERQDGKHSDGSGAAPTGQSSREVGIKELASGRIRLIINERRMFKGEREIALTTKEFDVLRMLMETPDRVYSRERLLDMIWGEGHSGDVRTVDVHIRRLREKIEEDSGNPVYIHTKWGIGYFFRNREDS